LWEEYGVLTLDILETPSTGATILPVRPDRFEATAMRVRLSISVFLLDLLDADLARSAFRINPVFVFPVAADRMPDPT
jgi:hypothetical protein